MAEINYCIYMDVQTPHQQHKAGHHLQLYQQRGGKVLRLKAFATTAQPISLFFETVSHEAQAGLKLTAQPSTGEGGRNCDRCQGDRSSTDDWERILARPPEPPLLALEGLEGRTPKCAASTGFHDNDPT
ncbi:hypothetical protein U0070_008217 [Myodes glareolus]|uniref:Uncharacterized protein n=1 Tax=Myodes glareolus TaxID=447135 RepID=A0AAW0HQ23_MYOGA